MSYQQRPRQSTNTNPFGDDPPTISSSSTTNPFEDAGLSGPTRRSKASPGGGGGVGVGVGTSRPAMISRLSSMPEKSSVKNMSISNNNPFDEGMASVDEETNPFAPGGGGGGGIAASSPVGGVGIARPFNALAKRARSLGQRDDLDDMLAESEAARGHHHHPKGAFSTNTNPFNNDGPNRLGLASWLRGNKAADEEDDDDDNSEHGEGEYPDVGASLQPQDERPGVSRLNSIGDNIASVGRLRQEEGGTGVKASSRSKKMRTPKKFTPITRWPYDNYHEEQERHYKEVEREEMNKMLYEEEDEDEDLPGFGGSTRMLLDGYTSGSDDEKKEERLTAGSTTAGGGHYERPAELPSIKEAVQNLSLVDFEKKAQERAIGIVSTWLFDAGLVDELLVYGGATRRASLAGAATPGGAGGGAAGKKGSEAIIPMDGGLKMDKEIDKLRNSVQRELSIVNSRLNDGVAASGAEVQELVNAVTATKGDLGRLRDLSTYISNGCKSEPGGEQQEKRDEFLLTSFPKLKLAINARRNIFRCFRELEFFSQIPSTCDRLREELHSGEWTTNEWSTIRNVCMEHVELEILLVEAEAGMKARIDYEDGGAPNPSPVAHQKSGRNLGLRLPSSRHHQHHHAHTSPSNYEMVDEFLSTHVKNVWELGDEIRMRILSGIGSSFDLAMNNPAGMVALVEAVEVYERAAEQYKELYEEEDKMPQQQPSNGGSGRGRLFFTDMRAAALAQLYQDFELRGLEVFRAIHMQAADMAEEDDARNSQFTGVLRAATELVAEIDLVKNQMAPCFAPHWAVEVLWSSCVAHVCSNQILQQIGGSEGQNLPDLTVTQLLDLVAWVEFFKETIEEAFPNVASMNESKKTYFDQRPDLFAGNNKEVNMDSAQDSLAWVNNMLWEVHRLAQQEFLVRTRGQTDEWLHNVYEADHTKNETSEGKLTTSLCEDVFSLASVQLRTIRERLSRKSDALVTSVCLILSHMRSKQMLARDDILQDLETCCAAANDFTRMSEKSEELMDELLTECDLAEDAVATLDATSSDLIALYSSDAVYAAQSVHFYIFEPIGEAIGEELFGAEWEEELTNNELALTLVRTLEDFMGDIEQFLDDFMIKKTVDAIASASVIFYVRCLLLKAESHNSVRVSCFNDNAKALERISGDIQIMRDYFEELVPDMPALGRVIEREFEILTTIHELMSIAAELSESDASDFIMMLHKKLRDVSLTQHVVGDLWHLVAPTQERQVWELVESMEMELRAIAPPDEAADRLRHDRSQVPGLRLDEVAAKLYIESKRKRPIKAGALEKIVTNWRTNWATDDSPAP